MSEEKIMTEGEKMLWSIAYFNSLQKNEFAGPYMGSSVGSIERVELAVLDASDAISTLRDYKKRDHNEWVRHNIRYQRLQQMTEEYPNE